MEWNEGIKAIWKSLYRCHVLKWICSIVSYFFSAPHPTSLKDSKKHVAQIADWQLLRHHYANVHPRCTTGSSEPRKELGIYVYVMKTRGWEEIFWRSTCWFKITVKDTPIICDLFSMIWYEMVFWTNGACKLCVTKLGGGFKYWSWIISPT